MRKTRSSRLQEPNKIKFIFTLREFVLHPEGDVNPENFKPEPNANITLKRYKSLHKCITNCKGNQRLEQQFDVYCHHRVRVA